jgi:FMN reductase
MAHLLMINGSPSLESRTGRLLDHFALQLVADGWVVDQLPLRTLPAEALLSANVEAPALLSAQRAVAQADALVIATPVYKGAYTGLLKAFLDVLPHRALIDKSVLPIASGGTLAHYGVIDYALKPVFAALGATFSLPGFFVLDADLKTAQGIHGFNAEIIDRLETSRRALKRLHQASLTPASDAPDTDIPLRQYGS